MNDLSFLSTEQTDGYLSFRLPTSLDDKIRAVIESLSTPDEYVELRRRVTDEQSMTLEVFAERAASLAVKQDDEGLLALGIVALYLAGFDEDEEAELPRSRETVLVLPLLFKSAKKMGVRIRRLIDAVEEIVGKERAAQLRKFWSWSPWRLSLKAMGYRESRGNDDPLLYERIPQ